MFAYLNRKVIRREKQRCQMMSNPVRTPFLLGGGTIRIVKIKLIDLA